MSAAKILEKILNQCVGVRYDDPENSRLCIGVKLHDSHISVERIEGQELLCKGDYSGELFYANGESERLTWEIEFICDPSFEFYDVVELEAVDSSDW